MSSRLKVSKEKLSKEFKNRMGTQVSISTTIKQSKATMDHGGKAMVLRRWKCWLAKYDDDDGVAIVSQSFEVTGGRVESARKTRQTNRLPTTTGAS